MVTVVYPFAERYAKFDELRLSIRSLQLHFTEPFNLVVIGDRPAWLNVKEATFISCPVISRHPVTDVANKMRTIIKHLQVSEDFIWMNDDIYLVNPVSQVDMKQPKAVEDLDEVYTRANGNVFRNTPYRRNMWNTYRALKSDGLPAINTCTHLPFFYNKDILQLVLDKYNVGDNLYLVSLLYHNNRYEKKDYWFIHNTNGYKAALYSNRSPDREHLGRMCARAKFFNHSDYAHKSHVTDKGNTIELFLRNRFATKSKFEL